MTLPPPTPQTPLSPTPSCPVHVCRLLWRVAPHPPTALSSSTPNAHTPNCVALQNGVLRSTRGDSWGGECAGKGWVLLTVFLMDLFDLHLSHRFAPQPLLVHALSLSISSALIHRNPTQIHTQNKTPPTQRVRVHRAQYITPSHLYCTHGSHTHTHTHHMIYTRLQGVPPYPCTQKLDWTVRVTQADELHMCIVCSV